MPTLPTPAQSWLGTSDGLPPVGSITNGQGSPSNIKARKPPPLPGGPAWFQHGFHAYLRRYLKRHFHALRLSLSGQPPLLEDAPTVIYVNHPSWWDPLIGLALSTLFYPKSQFCAPMDARQCQRYGVFKKLGFFPVEPSSIRGAMAFLSQAKQIFEHHPKAMLWLTPQGCFRDIRQRPVFFQAGLAHLARRHPQVRFQPLAVEYTFWNDRWPEVLVRFGTPVESEDLALASASIECCSRRLAESLQQCQDQLAEEAMTRQASLFQSLLTGRSGVGGFYDVWRKFQARWTGRQFQADHTMVP